MKDILKNPSYKNKDGYNGLDLSNPFAFSSSVGHIIPFYWDFVQAGDKVSLSAYLRTRTQPLISAAMADIEENVRFFYVPLNQLYSAFKEKFVGVNDFPSDLYSQNIIDGVFPDFIPQVKLGTFASYLARLQEESDDFTFIQTCRLAEAIGIPVYKILYYWNSSNRTHLQHSVNLLPFLAYQKIWFDHFRDTDRIENDPRYYNFDSFFTLGAPIGTSPVNPVVIDRMQRALMLRMCPCIKDAQNNLQVSPLFGGNDLNSLGTDLERVNQWLTGLSSVSTANEAQTASETVKPTTTFASMNFPMGVNPANLRAMFATEKLLEIVRRTPKHFDAQMLAQLGVKVPKGLDGESVSIGHHTQPLLIGDVISTANTYDGESGSMLGEIGGKGYSAEMSKDYKFDCPFTGVIMAVFYARPKYYYHPYGIDKKLAYTRISDFPRPQYDDLGMQPEFVMNQNLQDAQDMNTQIQGWQYRFQEVKTSKPLAFGALCRSLKNWVISKEGVFGNVPSNYYVKETDINQILEVPYDPYIDDFNEKDLFELNKSLFDTDPLINQVTLNYRKASKISVYGLPKLM